MTDGVPETPTSESSTGPTTRPISNEAGSTQQLQQACLAAIEDRRAGKVDLAQASLRLFKLLPSDEHGLDAYAHYAERLAEFERGRAVTLHRGIRLAGQLDDDGAGCDFGDGPLKRSHDDAFAADPDVSSKRPADVFLFGWRNLHEPAQITDPNLLRTLELKRNYLRDPKGARTDLLGRAGCPEFPDGLWIDVLLGHFLDLDKVYSGEYSLDAEHSHTHSFGEVDIVLNSGGGSGKPSRRVRTTESGPSHSLPLRPLSFSSIRTVLKNSPRTRSLSSGSSKRTSTPPNITVPSNSTVPSACAQQKPTTWRSITSTASRISSHLMSSSRRPPAHQENVGARATPTPTPTFANDGTHTTAPPIPASIDTSSSSVVRSTKRKRVGKEARTTWRGEGLSRWKRPKWTRGFLWTKSAPSQTPSSTYTEIAPPLPSVPLAELGNDAANATLRDHPQLFKIVTPIRVERFESLLDTHPNRPLVESVCAGLREGFWPYANFDVTAPETCDNAERDLDGPSLDFARQQRDAEIQAERFSESFGRDLLPGMSSMPIGVVPKPRSDKFRLVTDHSAGEHALNNFIAREDMSVRLDNLQDFGSICGRW